MHKTGPFTNSGVSKFVKLVVVHTKHQQKLKDARHHVLPRVGIYGTTGSPQPIPLERETPRPNCRPGALYIDQLYVGQLASDEDAADL